VAEAGLCKVGEQILVRLASYLDGDSILALTPHGVAYSYRLLSDASDSPDMSSLDNLMRSLAAFLWWVQQVATLHLPPERRLFFTP
jgi:hypothetical protein